MSKAPLLCGLATGPLFLVSVLIQGATRDGYDPTRHPVSSLALGEHGWMQTATFLIAGLLTAAFAIGLRRTLPRGTVRLWGPLLIGSWGIGLIGAGLLSTDPVSGYPPGTPNLLPAYGSTHAALHDGVSLVTFVAITTVCMTFTRRFVLDRRWGWALYTAGCTHSRETPGTWPRPRTGVGVQGACRTRWEHWTVTGVPSRVSPRGRRREESGARRARVGVCAACAAPGRRGAVHGGSGCADAAVRSGAQVDV
ncbi:DUF998 domain-containing protein [Spongiactinospora sp. TRM90649]|uniref:DUF998 domain-containing protein n=1 Tax=Spongiactinospora sp. TRM90649 TaxID=3031114 RepID=UPI0023F7325E|nr:DUF998 domain-containing protein [Spongiactinospora sp. TRM90649]MDF5751427.1 DUF998 domain-containing protein [Spongiactinospora sp. TRM90649]